MIDTTTERHKLIRALIVAIAVLAACSSHSQSSNKGPNPGSLWKNGNDVLADRTARREGDVITIIISESSSASYSANTKATKDDKTSIAKGIGPILANLIPALGVGANSSIDGKGSTTAQGQFSARMSAIVKKVLPNGTLLIEGTRTITTNKETQTIVLSGIVRREDIRTDNTVFSASLAEATIKSTSKGMINDRQRKGILNWLLDWLF